jgi:hypothetical protein
LGWFLYTTARCLFPCLCHSIALLNPAAAHRKVTSSIAQFDQTAVDCNHEGSDIFGIGEGDSFASMEVKLRGDMSVRDNAGLALVLDRGHDLSKTTRIVRTDFVGALEDVVQMFQIDAGIIKNDFQCASPILCAYHVDQCRYLRMNLEERI